ncbi:MAG TPA: ATP-binding cassette domain-containing protein [Candidatus Bathyarchaeia archaeon]
MPALHVENLVKVYPDGTKAVNDISFSVEDGEFFGFLGPNGAGKSTTIKIITTLLRKTSGKVIVSRHELDKDPQAIRRIIGVQAQETGVDEDLTGRENLELMGRLYGVTGDRLKERVNTLLKLVGLDAEADKRAGYYSGGMKKRLDLASALVHTPQILFLDEPTTGLDPQSRAAIWNYLKDLNKQQKVTIFLTTQYMEEADRLCDRIAIIDQGKIVASGTPTQLKAEIGADVITIAMPESELIEHPELRGVAMKLVEEVPGVESVSVFENGLSVYVRNGGSAVPEVVRALDNAKINVGSISLSSPSLDDVFLKHTGHRIRPEELKKPSRGMMFRRRRR